MGLFRKHPAVTGVARWVYLHTYQKYKILYFLEGFGLQNVGLSHGHMVYVFKAIPMLYFVLSFA
jgi:hypothetical protein